MSAKIRITTGMELLKPAAAAARLGIGVDRLRALVREGKITPSGHTPGGHRFYTVESIDKYQREKTGGAR